MTKLQIAVDALNKVKENIPDTQKMVKIINNALALINSTAEEKEDDWINVNDNLPEGDEWHVDETWTDQVIINVHHGMKTDYVSTGAMYLGKWYWWENRKLMSEDFKVTHWKPLPKSPSNSK